MNVQNLPSDFQKLRLEIITCKRCGAFRNCKTPVPFYGIHNSPVMFISKHPNEWDDIKGEMFADKQRTPGVYGPEVVFKRVLEYLELTKEEVYISYLMKCFKPNNESPTSAEISICYNNYLRKEIEWVDPQLIITFGKEAFEICTGLKNIKIDNVAGILFTDNNLAIFPLPSASYLLHKPSYKNKYGEHVGELRKLWLKHKEEIYARKFK